MTLDVHSKQPNLCSMVISSDRLAMAQSPAWRIELGKSLWPNQSSAIPGLWSSSSQPVYWCEVDIQLSEPNLFSYQCFSSWIRADLPTEISLDAPNWESLFRKLHLCGSYLSLRGRRKKETMMEGWWNSEIGSTSVMRKYPTKCAV